MIETVHDDGPHSSLAAMLHKVSLARPQDLAVLGEAGTGFDLTFAELARGAASVAAALQGLRAADVAGMFVEPSVLMSLALWGIVWSGRGYVPLAPEYPDERLSYIIESSCLKQVIVQSCLVDRLRAIAPADVEILRIEELLAGFRSDTRAATEIAPLPSGGDLAYVIYTSGSTGRPKGVEVPRSALVHQICWLAEQLYLTPDTRILQKTPISFDAAQWEILAPAVGACTVCGSVGIYRDTDALIARMAQTQVTHLQAVPTLLSALLQHEGFRALNDLRAIFSGGEALTRKLAGSILANMPWLKLVNLYGPTETTINATAHEVRPYDLINLNPVVSIGHPVTGMRCHVLDADLKATAVGQEGELYISGPQVARGYRNAPEQTAERFLPCPWGQDERMYRTGDKCVWQPDGTLHFLGRVDNQIKLRGYRVELEEIASSIATSPWVNAAAVVVTKDARSQEDRLIACIELNPRQAAVMDQDVAEGHHLSKRNKLQVKAQLSNVGLRAERSDEPVVPLVGQRETEQMRAEVFARKTYRFFDGSPLDLQALTAFLQDWRARLSGGNIGAFKPLTLERLGTLLRWMGQFHSEERLLPKYAYASPGALYATQLYLETCGVTGLQDGLHYYDPAQHCLRFVAASHPQSDLDRGAVRCHFAGRHAPFERVYKTNIAEVMKIEAGHMLGVLAHQLAALGQGVATAPTCEDLIARLDLPEEDYNIAAFDIVPAAQRWMPELDVFLQAHSATLSGLRTGTYRVFEGDLMWISEEMIRENDVIAINQSIFARSSFGLTFVGRDTDETRNYIGLGFAQHCAQANAAFFGFMASGYSSHSDHPLPAAKRFDRILAGCGIETGPSYFSLGGRVSSAQIESQGMNEDAVHMDGPAEMIRRQLKCSLPDYMIPNDVVIFDKLPLSANGKIDCNAIKSAPQLLEALAPRPYIAPEGPTQIALASLWASLLSVDEISQEDDFFALGGNSLRAIALLHRIKLTFGCALPTQAIFEHTVLRVLAQEIDRVRITDGTDAPKRLVRLNQQNQGRPIFIWPGLGGYPMNLRALAQEQARPVFGIQAQGLNEGETPAATIAEMARDDIAELMARHPEGPVTLWGYSFGARVAFEAAWQLEQQGVEVDQLVLVCPGNPSLPPELAALDPTNKALSRPRQAVLSDPSYMAILLSVFAGQIDIARTRRMLAIGNSEPTFLDHLCAEQPEMPREMAARIIGIVRTTYQFDYTFAELLGRRINAPMTVIKAKGDDYSFLEQATGFAARPVTTLTMPQNHYQVLQRPYAADLARLIQHSASQQAGAITPAFQD
ncbi:amino acid adenylation domain-containing protein [Agrobacterium vitis]